MDAASLVRNAKATSAKSFRTLAAEADVAASTVTRIEARQTHPTVPVLERILASCGFELELTVLRRGTPRRPRLRDLADAWTDRSGSDLQLDWTRWRAWLDELALHPEWVADAIYSPPPPAGHAVVDALLAGIAEKLADDAHLPRPAWTHAIPPLEEPYRPRTRRPREAPAQLAQRGVLIDSESLFRPKERLGL